MMKTISRTGRPWLGAAKQQRSFVEFATRSILVACICFGVSACGVSAEEQAADRMEAAFRESGLAVNSVDEYSQYFAKRQDGSVTGSFVIHIPSSGEWREIVRAACERDRIVEYPCNKRNYGVVDAGNRQWVPSEIDLPARAGGGCTLVRIDFDASANEISDPVCNGPF